MKTKIYRFKLLINLILISSVYFFDFIISKPDITIPISSTIIAAQTFEITKPGYYILLANVFINKNRTDPLIKISSSDVIIDFNSYGIINYTNNLNSNFDGIIINENYENISILNGYINNINGTGIIIKPNSKNIFIKNLFLANCKSLAIKADNISNLQIKQIEILNMNDTNKATGIEINNSKEIFISKTKINSITANQLTNGLSLINCKNGKLKLIKINNQSADESYGINLTNCNNFFLDKISINNINSINKNAIGLFINTSNNITIENSKLFNITTINDKAIGISLENSNNNYLKNNQAFNNKSFLNGEVYGFRSLNGLANSFFECASFNNSTDLKSTENILVAGMALEGLEQNSIISKCKIFNNISEKGKTFGIKLGSKDDNNLVTNCKVAENLIDLNFGFLEQYGIKDFSEASTNIFLKNQATGQGRSLGNDINTKKGNFYWTARDADKKMSNTVFETDKDYLKTLRITSPYDNISIN